MGTAHQTRSGSYRWRGSDPLLSLPFDYGKMREIEYPSRKMTFTILLPTKQRS
jgi:hypothetical protein